MIVVRRISGEKLKQRKLSKDIEDADWDFWDAKILFGGSFLCFDKSGDRKSGVVNEVTFEIRWSNNEEEISSSFDKIVDWFYRRLILSLGLV